MEEEFQIDKKLLRHSFSKAADDYEAVAVLQYEVERRLLERLDLVRLQPKAVLDLGCGTGRATEALLTRYRGASVVGCDISEAMLSHTRRRGRWLRRPQCTCGDAESLPFQENSFDLIFSSLMLQWCGDFDRAMQECQRVLKPGGLLIFTTFGPDTLIELRRSWAAVDNDTHVNAFLDMHDIGDALLRQGFAEPVMDVERLTMTYESVNQLMRDLKQLGAHNINAGRRHGLTGKQRLQAVIDAYEQYRSDALLPATYEIVNGHAWVPESGVRVSLER
ncbi:MAG: malonyl-ACP O-methyltransferase BioC [Gammaproteobacteria bacterium]